MGIHVQVPGNKMPEGLKLANKIASYLFEQECGECKSMEKSELEALKAGLKALSKAVARSAEKNKH